MTLGRVVGRQNGVDVHVADGFLGAAEHITQGPGLALQWRQHGFADVGWNQFLVIASAVALGHFPEIHAGFLNKDPGRIEFAPDRLDLDLDLDGEV